MKKQIFFAIVLIGHSFALLAQPKVQLQDFATGFTRPVDIAHCGDSRLFVVEQAGKIWILDSLGNRLPDVFLDIQTRVRSSGNEQGLLGLAFPPNYDETGHFFVNYTRQTDGATRVSRFTRELLNPNKADPNSELIILSQSQPFTNHNGGCVKFGPDGYLYIALGDGGSGGDPQDNSQKKNTLLGKILRIDVSNSSGSQPYAVPSDNPFVGDAAYSPEIWSLGWRNPWRFSFDRLTGDMWIGDVGQNAREEIDFEPANTPGINYGWRCYEGTASYNTSGCLGASNYESPAFNYVHSGNGCSVTGGFVYRGTKYPDLYGCYLFADYCSGRWWYMRRNANGTFTATVLTNFSANQYSSFGEDKDGELYVTLLGMGKIQKVRELCSPFQVSLVNIESPVCPNSFSGLLGVSATGGANPISYLWSNGTTQSDAVYLNPGSYTVAVTDGNGCVRRDTFEIAQIGPDAPTLTASDSVICPGQSIMLTASNLAVPNTLNWYLDGQVFATTTSSETSWSLSVMQSGTYSVLLVDSLCALNSSEIVATEEAIVPAFVGQLGDTVVASVDCEQWLLDGQPIPGAVGSTYLATTSGFYECQFTTVNGCVYTPGYQVTITGTTLPPTIRHFSLSPNPAQDEVMLKLELEKTEVITLLLSNAQQKQVFAQTHQTQDMMLPIDLRNLPAGTYFLTVQTEGGRFVRKLVKNR